jgi:hypothetical protein
MGTGILAFSLTCVIAYVVYQKYAVKEEKVMAGSSENEVNNEFALD